MALVVFAACRAVMDVGDPQLIELGATCAGYDDQTCSPEAPSCISLSGSAYFCTASCGSGPAGSGSGAPIPPPDGDAICRSLISMGTPWCGLYGEAKNGVVPWSCAILCGTLGSDDLGGCPAGLTCVSNGCR